MKYYEEHQFSGSATNEEFRLRELPQLTATSVLVQGKTTGTLLLTAKRYGSNDYEVISDGLIDLAAGERGLDIFGSICELKVTASIPSAYTLIIVQMEG